MKKFKIGDKVILKGTIENISKAGEYIININFYYFAGGKFYCKEDSIFHDTTQERVVQVRDSQDESWVDRVFIMEKNEKFLCWANGETLDEAKKATNALSWNFMREVPKKRVITLQEIADKFNIDVEQIEIKK
jgi:hypothetical protein